MVGRDAIDAVVHEHPCPGNRHHPSGISKRPLERHERTTISGNGVQQCPVGGDGGRTAFVLPAEYVERVDSPADRNLAKVRPELDDRAGCAPLTCITTKLPPSTGSREVDKPTAISLPEGEKTGRFHGRASVHRCSTVPVALNSSRPPGGDAANSSCRCDQEKLNTPGIATTTLPELRVTRSEEGAPLTWSRYATQSPSAENAGVSVPEPS